MGNGTISAAVYERLKFELGIGDIYLNYLCWNKILVLRYFQRYFGQCKIMTNLDQLTGFFLIPRKKIKSVRKALVGL